ncbi:MAG: pyruvate kinase [Deltaproteobacteria bacterium]|nr:pyruvate kinase [Deltaproteobacteria bacterium]
MKLSLPCCKTKLICTIGPSSHSEKVLRNMLESGMSIARLNFSHGTFEDHKKDIQLIRSTAAGVNRIVPILVDLPGPKIRVGILKNEPMLLERGSLVTLTTEQVHNTDNSIPVTYSRLTESVHPKSVIYLNDGFIELEVIEVKGTEVDCRVISGGHLLSGKGLNLPGARLFADSPTERDLDLMGLALDEGISIFGISFVESAEAIERTREFARKKGKEIYAVAKIERASAVDNIDEILQVADALMIARGDLGVEVPIEEVPALQKELIRKANIACRPVITATQMLESMVENTRPTRAETTDVANAILDGTDAVMLSEETAIGKYPVQTVSMMARIATVTETRRRTIRSAAFIRNLLHEDLRRGQITVPDMISLNASETAMALDVKFILTPTETGTSARRIARFKPEGWIIASNPQKSICEFLFFSYGVYPTVMETAHTGWHDTLLGKLKEGRFIQKSEYVIMTEGRFSKGEGSTDSLSIITV